MRKSILIIVLCLSSLATQLWAQEALPSNQTIIRLTIMKDNDKILMRKTQYGWMTPAVYFKKRQNVTEVLDSLASMYDIEITQPQLKGLFTYKYEFKPTADMRQLYVASYISGQLKPQVAEEEIYWMPIKEALDRLESTVPALMHMTKQVLDSPNTLWGGAFMLYRDGNNLQSRMEENFYPLFEIQ